MSNNNNSKDDSKETKERKERISKEITNILKEINNHKSK